MKIEVLDHGYVEFIEAWGRGSTGPLGERPIDPDYERGIIEAARQSTQGSFRGWERDQWLLNFLYDNKHATPFEFAGVVIEVQAPIFVFREWHRHRTQSYNEMSARYAPLPDLYYEPHEPNVWERANAARTTTNKQEGATSTDPLSRPEIDYWLTISSEINERLEQHYQLGLKIGVPKEVARINMPVNHYSRMRASANLRNWLAFLTLRMDPNAQWEIRQFANAVGKVIADTFPQTWARFDSSRDD